MIGTIFSFIAGSRLGRLTGALVAGVLVVLGALALGRRQGRTAADLRAMREANKSYKTREEIDNAVQGDSNLAKRARDAGIVRPTGDK